MVEQIDAAQNDALSAIATTPRPETSRLTWHIVVYHCEFEIGVAASHTRDAHFGLAAIQGNAAASFIVYIRR